MQKFRVGDKMTPIINTRSDLDALQGADIYADALRSILGSTTTWVNKAPQGAIAQWELVSVTDTLRYLDLTLEELLSECAAAGITPTTPPAPVDKRFYDLVQSSDGSWAAIPKDLAGLKTSWTAQFKQTAYTMLLPSDWLIIRKQENNTDIPADWTTYREAVRVRTADTITALEAATDIDAFIAAVTNVEWPVSPDNQPMVAEPIQPVSPAQ